MTRSLYALLTVLGTAVAVQAQQSSPFTINGQIPGLKAGGKVKLVNIEYGQRKTIATATSTEGGFRLEGSVASPTLCWLDVRPDAEDMGKEVTLMVDKGTMTVSVAHVDSLPPGFTFTTEKLCKERNVTVTGGPSQEEFTAYRSAMLPYEIAAKEIHYMLYNAPDADRNNTVRSDSLQALLNKADKEVASAKRDFITRHPDYAISAYLWCELLEEPFSFTAEELDQLLELTKANRDTVRLVELRQAVEKSRSVMKGVKYTDFGTLDTDKGEHKMSEYVLPENYTFIDFWASWCGPCRAAIPHVRGLYKQYKGKLNVYSVSLDAKEADWRRAMEEEKMEWTQLWLPKEKQKAALEAYAIRGIPFLLLVSPQGEILYAGNSASEVSAVLEKHIGGASTDSR